MGSENFASEKTQKTIYPFDTPTDSVAVSESQVDIKTAVDELRSLGLFFLNINYNDSIYWICLTLFLLIKKDLRNN